MSTLLKARFDIGQLVQHTLFNYRGVIIDVDATFQGTDEWYSQNAPSHPPKDKPWYRILVHGSVHHAYAAESQLEEDLSEEAIEHPELDYFFDDFQNGGYHKRRSSN
jgi:heat shock protein HspQ